MNIKDADGVGKDKDNSESWEKEDIERQWTVKTCKEYNNENQRHKNLFLVFLLAGRRRDGPGLLEEGEERMEEEEEEEVVAAAVTPVTGQWEEGFSSLLIPSHSSETGLKENQMRATTP